LKAFLDDALSGGLPGQVARRLTKLVHLIDELLVDKQNGRIQFTKRS